MIITLYKAYATMLDLLLVINHRVVVHFWDAFIPVFKRELPVIKAVFHTSLYLCSYVILNFTSQCTSTKPYLLQRGISYSLAQCGRTVDDYWRS